MITTYYELIIPILLVSFEHPFQSRMIPELYSTVMPVTLTHALN